MSRVIHDFYGFPQTLYQERYPAKGNPAPACEVGSRLTAAQPTVDHFLPALMTAGASERRYTLTFMTDKIALGSVSMHPYVSHSG